MVSAAELAALIEQAARNLESLELLARSLGEGDPNRVKELRERLRELQLACRRETDALTQHVLKDAVERRAFYERRGGERRREPAPAGRSAPDRRGS
jgi:hypothetical protein